MSKYEKLWRYVAEQSKNKLILTFDEVEKICECKLDHSFLSHKKELLIHGFEVNKISMTNKTVEIVKGNA